MCKVEIQLILNILFFYVIFFFFFIYQCQYNKLTLVMPPDITEILLKVALNTINPTLVVEIFLLYSF